MLKPGAIKDINKKHGDGGEDAVSSLEDEKPVVRWYSTGCASVDVALGGGVPSGRIIEIYGQEESGKTALCLSIAKSVQDQGEDVLWIDAEYSLVPEHLIALDESRFYINHPDYGERALDIALDAIQNGVGLVVVDSVPALTPKAEVDGTMEQQQVGALARLMSRFLRKGASLVARSESTLIFVNQTRLKIGVMYGNPETTPGGKALGYYASIRARISKKEDIKNGAEVVGMRCAVSSTKNRLAPRKREGYFEIMFTGEMGIDKVSGLLDAAASTGVITNKGGWISVTNTGERIGHGKDESKLMLRNNPTLADDIYRQIIEAV